MRNVNKRYIGFKLINESSALQQPALYDLLNDSIIKLHKLVERCSQVSFAKDGTIAFMIENKLFIQKGDVEKEFLLPHFSNLLSLSPDAKNIVFRDKKPSL
ncbi:MAG: hypothetical protein K8S23_10015 [Candidatus Cloacimonetes bacterium]|nr:hypothetical protein [Candidatus Cloacimonadota bacterium]